MLSLRLQMWLLLVQAEFALLVSRVSLVGPEWIRTQAQWLLLEHMGVAEMSLLVQLQVQLATLLVLSCTPELFAPLVADVELQLWQVCVLEMLLLALLVQGLLAPPSSLERP